jgi:proteasome lid subunit RPN8/RPN11
VFGSRLRNLLARPDPLLKIEPQVWQEVLHELRVRGAGRRESGAFLLGPADRAQPRHVTAAVYYDDLDPTSLTGGISFSGSAYSRLWDECAARGLEVVGDVHTHPGQWVAQSPIDRAHPMLAQAGHVGLIVPQFAQNQVKARDVGVHEYLGDGRWRSWLGRDAKRRLLVGGRRWWR